MSRVLKLLSGASMMAALLGCSATQHQTDDAKVIERQIQIIRERIDPHGVINPIIRSVGHDRIEIALPKTTEAH